MPRVRGISPIPQFSMAIDESGLYGDENIQAAETEAAPLPYEDFMTNHEYNPGTTISQNVDIGDSGLEAKSTNYSASRDLTGGKEDPQISSMQQALTEAIVGIVPMIAGGIAGGKMGAGIGGEIGAGAAQKYADGVKRDKEQYRQELLRDARATRKEEKDKALRDESFENQKEIARIRVNAPTAMERNAAAAEEAGIPANQFFDRNRGTASNPAMQRMMEAKATLAEAQAQKAKNSNDALNITSRHFDLSPQGASWESPATKAFVKALPATDAMLDNLQLMRKTISDPTVIGDSAKAQKQLYAIQFSLMRDLQGTGASLTGSEAKTITDVLANIGDWENVLAGKISGADYLASLDRAEAVIKQVLASKAPASGFNFNGFKDPDVDEAVNAALSSGDGDEIQKIVSTLTPSKQEAAANKIAQAMRSNPNVQREVISGASQAPPGLSFEQFKVWKQQRGQNVR